jgi:hypothetical protein
MSLFLGRPGGTLIVRRHRHLNVNDEEDDPENETDEGDDEIGDSEEIIFPAHPRGVGEDEGFSSVERDDRVVVPVFKTDIAWPTDKSTKFQNPPGKTLQEAFNGSVRPPFWSKDVWQLDTENDANNGYQNEDFIVWMRTAALPNFRTLYRRGNHADPHFKDGLPAGKYKLDIKYNYPVVSFDGTKTLILANTSWMGGKNNFLAIAYFVVSLICLILGVVFLIIHIKMPMPTNNQSPAGSAEEERH